MMEVKRNLITLKEALARGKFSKSKCYGLINADILIAYHQGRQTMIDSDSLDAYQASLPRIMPKKKPARKPVSSSRADQN